MFNQNMEITPFDTRCWNGVLDGLRHFIKGIVKETVEEAISDKICNLNIEDKRLNAVELCKRWNISKNTLRTWEQNGVIRPLPLGGKKKVYSMADIHTAEVNGFVKTVC